MYTPASLPANEPARLQALDRLKLMDTPLEQRFERITHLARERFGVDMAAVSLVGEDRQFFKSIQGLATSGTTRNISLSGHTILEPDLLVVPDATDDKRFAANPLVEGPPYIAFYAGHPLRTSDGHAVGSLCLFHREPRAFGPQDEARFRDLAAQAEAEVNAPPPGRLQGRLVAALATAERRAHVDALTRVWNRDGIRRLAAEAVSETADGGAGCALVALDLDRFERTVTEHGQRVGDELLRAVVRLVLASVRETDIIGRLDDDEFLVVLTPCPTAEEAATIADRIRSRLAKAPVATDHTPVGVTASIGVRYIGPGDVAVAFDALLDAAGHALATSKRSGRNRLNLDPGRERAA